MDESQTLRLWRRIVNSGACEEWKDYEMFKAWIMNHKQPEEGMEFLRKDARPFSPQNSYFGFRGKPVIATNVKTGEKRVFHSMNCAARELNCNVQNIWQCCHKYRGYKCTHRGWKFSFASS